MNSGTRIVRKQVIVDMADMKTTNEPSGQLTTYVLGACVAVAIYDPKVRVGGLLHYILPESALNPKRALNNPYIFADTGIPLLFRSAYKLGAQKERIICRLAGAANVLDPELIFRLGPLNHLAATTILRKNNVPLTAEHVGGLAGMKLTLHLGTGRAVVSIPGGEEAEL